MCIACRFVLLRPKVWYVNNLKRKSKNSSIFVETHYVFYMNQFNIQTEVGVSNKKREHCFDTNLIQLETCLRLRFEKWFLICEILPCFNCGRS